MRLDRNDYAGSEEREAAIPSAESAAWPVFVDSDDVRTRVMGTAAHTARSTKSSELLVTQAAARRQPLERSELLKPHRSRQRLPRLEIARKDQQLLALLIAAIGPFGLDHFESDVECAGLLTVRLTHDPARPILQQVEQSLVVKFLMKLALLSVARCGGLVLNEIGRIEVGE